VKSAARILVVVLLLGVGFVIMQANQTTAAAQSAYEMLDATLDSGGSSLTAEEVHTKLGREPSSTLTPDKHTVIEHYEWSSLMRQHTLKVYYNKAATELMTKIELD
jgi:hypothetical protein